jgi:hypothetical protein
MGFFDHQNISPEAILAFLVNHNGMKEDRFVQEFADPGMIDEYYQENFDELLL